MSIEEAIKMALEYEHRVRDTYREAEANAEDPVGKRVFATLAKEEQGHVDYLKSKLEELHRTGHVTPDEIETVVPPPEVIAQGLARLESKELLSEERRNTEVELLRRALALEVETGNFYRRMVSELPEEGQRFFERFVEIEAGHEAIVQAEIDAVQGNGFYFDMAEFRLEQG